MKSYHFQAFGDSQDPLQVIHLTQKLHELPTTVPWRIFNLVMFFSLACFSCWGNGQPNTTSHCTNIAAPTGEASHSGRKHDSETQGKQFTSLKLYLKFCLKSPPSHLLNFSDVRKQASFFFSSHLFLRPYQSELLGICHTRGTGIFVTIPFTNCTSYALRQHPELRPKLVSHFGVGKAQKQSPGVPKLQKLST